MSYSACTCVRVFVCVHDNPQNDGSVNLNHEYTVVRGNCSALGHDRKLKFSSHIHLPCINSF